VPELSFLSYSGEYQKTQLFTPRAGIKIRTSRPEAIWELATTPMTKRDRAERVIASLYNYHPRIGGKDGRQLMGKRSGTILEGGSLRQKGRMVIMRSMQTEYGAL